ncbi:MAG TPA: dTMP kinase [Candidatus Nanoarchaeia archaeon]|nr:dTMP kinase [Candidatus Nanoarchaeia archaeon]
MTGKLIVFEGLDGSGKATQTKLLVQKMKSVSKQVTTIDFPQYGSWGAVFVEKYLNGELGTLDEITPQQASLFYALDRFAARKKLLQWLEQGKIIVANRYVAANQAYQGSKVSEEKRAEFLEWLDKLEHEILQLPRPTITIYLRMPLEVSTSLIEKRRQRDYIKDGNKDLHEKSESLLQNAWKVYEQLAKKSNWITVDCVDNVLKSKEVIHEMVLEKVKQFL